MRSLLATRFPQAQQITYAGTLEHPECAILRRADVSSLQVALPASSVASEHSGTGIGAACGHQSFTAELAPSGLSRCSGERASFARANRIRL